MKQYPYAIAQYFTLAARQEAANKLYEPVPQHDATVIRRYIVRAVPFMREEFCPMGVMIRYEDPADEVGAPSSTRVRNYILKRDHLAFSHPTASEIQSAAVEFLSDWDSNIIPTHLLAAALGVSNS